MSETCIVYYHSCRWDGIPGRQRLLMQAISRYVPVFYIQESSQKNWRVTYEKRGTQVTLIHGLAPVLVKFERRKWNWAMKLWCRWHLGWLRNKYRRIIFWDSENWLRPYRFITYDTLVYDCIDPSFSDDPVEQRLFAGRERELLGAADLVFASADQLARHCREANPHVTLLNNACDPAEYCEPRLVATPRPSWWPATDKPIAAYLGSMDWRFDYASTEAACRLNPGVHFVLAGNVLQELEPQLAGLAKLPNVTIPGPVSLDDGRYLMAKCQVGLIPFTMGMTNNAINPVKMYVYALLGKPIVGTAIHELVSRPEIVETANSPEEFAAAVRRAISAGAAPIRRKSLIDFALANTWDHRARVAMEKLGL